MYCMLIFGIICIICGIIPIIRPHVIYKIKEGWKSDGKTEPSDLYIMGIRGGGIGCIVIGLLCIISFFLPVKTL